MIKQLSLTLLFSFAAFSQQKAVKDSFDFYRETNQFQKAIAYSDKKADYFLQKKDYGTYLQHITNKSIVLNKDIKDPKRSLKVIYDALAKLKTVPDFIKVKAYPELSKSYFNLQQFDKAIDIAKKGLVMAKSSKNDVISLELNYCILSAYLSTTDTQNAFKYLEPTLKEAKKINDYSKLANTYNTHFGFYSYIKERDIAKKYLDSSIYYAEKAQDKTILNTVKGNLGVHYLTEEIDYEKARNIYLELIAENKNDTISEAYATYYLNLSYAEEKLGNLQKAINYNDKYVGFLQGALAKNMDSEIEAIRTKYEIEKAEQTFRERELLLEQKQHKSEKIMYLMLAMLTFAGILFYFFYQNLKLRQKNKLKDVHHNVQQNLVNATIDGQEEERKRLSGVLHDNISALLSSAGLHLMAFETNHPEINDELKKTKAIIKEAHDKVRDLSHALIPPVLEKLGLIPALEDLCEKNSNSLIHFHFSNFIEEDLRFQNEFEMKLYFIVAELFNNIMKHSNAAEAFLTIDKTDNQLAINIEDNGKGFNTSEGKPKAGLGLSQIKTRIKTMNGSISINSKEDAGTLIYIKVQIP